MENGNSHSRSLKLTHPLNKFGIEFIEFHWLEVLLDIVNNIGVFKRIGSLEIHQRSLKFQKITQTKGHVELNH